MQDVPPPVIGDQFPPPAIVSPPIGVQPIPTLPLPDLIPDLTRSNALPLSSAQPQSRTEECKCEDEEEEGKEPRPSNVVATVRGFRRRMSLNSLENLR